MRRVHINVAYNSFTESDLFLVRPKAAFNIYVNIGIVSIRQSIKIPVRHIPFKLDKT